MDVSTKSVHSAGRKPIQSTVLRKNQVGQVYRQFRSQVQAGSQVLSITPQLSESVKVDCQNAEQLLSDMQKAVGDVGQVSCLHGKK